MIDPDRVVLVTGAARRIGACIVRRFHQRGFRVLIHYHHSGDEARALAQELNAQRPESADTLQADLTHAAAVERLGQEALRAFDRVDVLVNNASAFYPTPFGDSSQVQWDELMDSNVRAAYFLSQALSTSIRRQQGSIINIVDTHADTALAGFAIYSMAKAGLKTMTRALARELAPDVRVNGVSPGAILWPPALADDQDPQVRERRRQVLAQIPLGHLGEPRHIAAAVCFLACDAGYVTGQVIRVDGGRSLA